MIEAVGGWVLNNASNLAGLLVLAAALGLFWRKKVAPVVELITAQLRPNGGGSLLDKVSRIGPNHEEARGHWKTLELAVHEINLRLAHADKRLQRLETASEATIAREKALHDLAAVVHNEAEENR